MTKDIKLFFTTRGSKTGIDHTLLTKNPIKHMELSIMTIMGKYVSDYYIDDKSIDYFVGLVSHIS